ncbi:SDR family oxidoreductase [Kocuria sp. cx-116]|uniref:SDR family NAD(P)-dependent oxidoreductase n=1 Tax=Kocuria sp. cx-116 TaxID=2771378 RepID=UPI001682B9B3|nr:SDR family oxidoreductase [Kocuria sp. cx-116]MBD2762747.1 SDR family oxidoreductase [Kocuria sp. cx-116]
MTKTALITGATGGIGRAFTAELHRRGYQVIITGRSTEKLTELSQTVTGGAAQIVAANLATPEGIGTLVDVIRSNPLDILVNNAGFGTHGSFAELDLQRELEQATVNMTALLTATHEALRSMTARRTGAILNIASVAGFQPLPYMATYGASKAFVDKFSLAVGAEARTSGVLVTSVNPGPVDTQFFDVVGSDAVNIGRALSPEQVVASAMTAVDKRRSRVVVPRAFHAVEAITRVLPASLMARAASIVSGR